MITTISTSHWNIGLSHKQMVNSLNKLSAPTYVYNGYTDAVSNPGVEWLLIIKKYNYISVNSFCDRCILFETGAELLYFAWRKLTLTFKILLLFHGRHFYICRSKTTFYKHWHQVWLRKLSILTLNCVPLGKGSSYSRSFDVIYACPFVVLYIELRCKFGGLDLKTSLRRQYLTPKGRVVKRRP